jgi:serine/threonine-protein kinase
MTTTGAAGVREGEILAGKYRVDRVLGAGGMGVVVAAHHIELDERVAIKFLLPEVATHGEAVARFAREARAAVKIKSEHVARVTDVGRLESGAPYMVMEYLEGSDLAGWLAKRGRLPVEQAVEFVLQACEAIAEAHALGIVHRDLKPGNLFVIRRPDGALSVKVLDFGISKAAFGADGSGAMTRTSALMGSPLYMSPEQMQSSRDVDPRSDIWSLGIILYELISGKQPFVAETMPELVLRVVHGAPAAPLRTLQPGVLPALERVVERCLEKDRRARFASVAELAVALAPFAPQRARISVERIAGVMQGAGFSELAATAPHSSGAAALPPHGAPSTAAAVSGPLPSATEASFGKTTLTPRKRSAWFVAGATVLALGVAGAAWKVGSSLDASEPSTSSLAPNGESPDSARTRVVPPTDTAAQAEGSSAAPAVAPVASPIAVPASTPPSAAAALPDAPRATASGKVSAPASPKRRSGKAPASVSTVPEARTRAPAPASGNEPDIFDDRK